MTTIHIHLRVRLTRKNFNIFLAKRECLQRLQNFTEEIAGVIKFLEMMSV